jgi:glucose/arabinose dehydrogenase
VALGVLTLGALGAGVGLGAAAVADDDGPSPSRAAADRPCARPYVELQAAELPEKGQRRLELVGRVDEPTALAFDPRHPDHGLLGSRTGELRVVSDGGIRRAVVLDLAAGTLGSGDGGLLALAYDPVVPWLYVYRTTRQQDEELLAFPLDTDGLPVAGDVRTLLEVDHPPSEQHHGGGMAFGPDGFLYLSLGDGGGLGDPRENAQDPGTLLGKVLRIDPTPEGPEPYLVPEDNPFVGDRGRRPEIWALGLRNPFRLTFEPTTGDLWVGDVGQSCWEELDRLPAGEGGLNLGWDVREGPTEFEGGALTGGASVEPELSYAHRRGWCAVVLGFFDDTGALLHTDYCRGRLVWFLPRSTDEPAHLVDSRLRVRRPAAIVAGPGGEPWVLSLEGEVFRVTR